MSNEQMRPASKEQAPDTAVTYERAKPEQESPSGQLDQPKTPPANTPDKMEQSVPHQQNTTRQINSEDSETGKSAESNTPQASQNQPDHSMKDEPETGWDTAPNDINTPQAKRHPRTGGKGATPDVGGKPTNS